MVVVNTKTLAAELGRVMRQTIMHVIVTIAIVFPLAPNKVVCFWII